MYFVSSIEFLATCQNGNKLMIEWMRVCTDTFHWNIRIFNWRDWTDFLCFISVSFVLLIAACSTFMICFFFLVCPQSLGDWCLVRRFYSAATTTTNETSHDHIMNLLSGLNNQIRTSLQLNGNFASQIFHYKTSTTFFWRITALSIKFTFFLVWLVVAIFRRSSVHLPIHFLCAVL